MIEAKGGEKVKGKKDKDVALYLDKESYDRLDLLSEDLDMTIQDYVYHRLFFFFLNQQELPKASTLKGGDRYVHLRIPPKIYAKIKKLAKEHGIKLSEVIRRIVLGTENVPQGSLKKKGGNGNDK
jgi:predicted DNA-binding protein